MRPAGHPGLLPSGRSPIGTRNIGRVRLVRTRRQLLRRTRLTPAKRTRFSYRWCVRGSRGRVTAVFSAASAPPGPSWWPPGTRPHLKGTGGNRRVRPGSSMRRLRSAYPRLARMIDGSSAAPESPRVFGVGRGRVR